MLKAQDEPLSKESFLQEAQSLHHESLLHAISCCGDYMEAQEIIGDIYLEIEQEKLRYLPQGATPKTFLFAVIRKKAKNTLRRIALRASKYLTGLFSNEALNPEATLSAKQEILWLRRSIQSLPPRMQEVLRLRYLEGRSVKECQLIMKVNSPGTISEQERRGIERLQEMAKQEQLR